MTQKILPFVLFSGKSYYPRPAWRDYVGSFETLEEARLSAKAESNDGMWWQVVDLRKSEIVDGYDDHE